MRIHEPRNTQSSELRFCALVIESGTQRVEFARAQREGGVARTGFGENSPSFNVYGTFIG
jgi:hypothetical protein